MVWLQEADMDEEGDAERAAQWDLAAADAAYKAQVEAALAHQRAVEEEHRLLLEQLEVLNHPSTQPGDVCACVLGVGGGGGSGCSLGAGTRANVRFCQL